MTHQLQIAIADSSPLIRDIFAALPADRYAVRAVARSRAELEQAVASQPLDAILCSDDLSGPMGGIEALRQLSKAKLVSADTAVLLMVHSPSKEHLLACTQVQPDAILLKPFSLQMFTSRLERAIQARQRYSKFRKLEEAQNWTELLGQAQYRQSSATGGHPLDAQFEITALKNLGRSPEAQTRLERLLAQSPGLLWAEESMVRQELAKGDWAAAETRMQRLVSDHPSHVEAQDMLYQFKRDQGDLRAAQRPLRQLSRYTGNVSHTRELGHLAVLNGDLDSAVLAYSSAMQAHDQSKPVEDLVNYTRAILLNGDRLPASYSMMVQRLRNGRDVLLPVLELLISSAHTRVTGELGHAQGEVLAAIRLMEGVPPSTIPLELKLMAVEQCLAVDLSYQAAVLSRAMLMDSTRPAPELQAEWLFRLHDWARDRPADAGMPRGWRRNRSMSQ